MSQFDKKNSNFGQVYFEELGKKLSVHIEKTVFSRLANMVFFWFSIGINRI